MSTYALLQAIPALIMETRRRFRNELLMVLGTLLGFFQVLLRLPGGVPECFSVQTNGCVLTAPFIS